MTPEIQSLRSSSAAAQILSLSMKLTLTLLLSLSASLPISAGVTVTRTNYHGWPESILLANSKAEVLIVPLINRVMQFRFIGEEGVFWENPALFGQIADMRLTTWASRDWVNFGGDKSWPSPEGDWNLYTGRKGWRPPPAFDGASASVKMEGNTVVLSTEPDPFYGIRMQRKIQLHSSRPELSITTTFERVRGEPSSVGIWVITQLKHPEQLFAHIARRPVFTNGCVRLSQAPPPSLRLKDGLIQLERDLKTPHKIGLDADRLLWVGAQHTLLIECPRKQGKPYPDGGSNTEIYTSPDPLSYIELETLGPVEELKVGQRLKHINLYTLGRRKSSVADLQQEAQSLLR
jgi:hypothetical protein